jgi:hypothetical protein
LETSTRTGPTIYDQRFLEWPIRISQSTESALGQLLFDGKRHRHRRERPRSSARLARCQQQSSTRGATPGGRSRQQTGAVALGALGQGDRCQHTDAQSRDFLRRDCPDIYEGIIHGEGGIGDLAAPSQVDRSNSHDSRDRASPALDRDPMTLQLLIEQRCHPAGHPT